MIEDASRYTLDELGILHGTDKSSISNDYLRHYERAIGRFRADAFNLIEIGVWNGGSVATWKDFFPNATIVGIDLLEKCLRYAQDRIVIEIGSQGDPAFLRRVARSYPPKVVIDDGSHKADLTLVSFESLFPELLPGGCYIIEDLQYHADPAGAKRPADGEPVPQDLAVNVARSLMDARPVPGLATPSGRSLVQAIDRVEMVHAAVFIWKKERSTPDLARLTELVERCPTADNWNSLARYASRVARQHEPALEAARKAIALEPKDWRHHNRLASVFEAAGDLPRATEALAQSAALVASPMKERILARRSALIGKADQST